MKSSIHNIIDYRVLNYKSKTIRRISITYNNIYIMYILYVYKNYAR